MDIEEIRRLNRMTAELKKHGMASDSMDAYQQARGEQKKQEEPYQPQQTDDLLIEKKLEVLISINNKKFQEAITILSGQINELNQQVSTLKQELKQNKTTQQTIPPPTPQKSTTPVKENHPRQGAFSSADVSIEKMFYFGNK